MEKEKKAKVISIINLKGGVGKTTLTMMIGEFLASVGKKVLLIDMDAQSNLTTAMMKPEDIGMASIKGATIYRYIDKRLREELKKDGIKDYIEEVKKYWVRCSNIKPLFKNENLQLIPSEVELAKVDYRLLENRSFNKKVYLYLNDLVKLLKNDFDYIFFDCPPNLFIWTANAIVASDYLLIPVIPESLSLKGIELISKSVNDLFRDNKKILEKEGLLEGKCIDDPFYGGNNRWFYTPEDPQPPGMFLGCIVNKFDMRRQSHLGEFNKIYGEPSTSDTGERKDFGIYRPFYNWIGDVTPFYLLGDFNNYPNYPDERFWKNIGEKWGYSLKTEVKTEEGIEEIEVKKLGSQIFRRSPFNQVGSWDEKDNILEDIKKTVGIELKIELDYLRKWLTGEKNESLNKALKYIEVLLQSIDSGSILDELEKKGSLKISFFSHKCGKDKKYFYFLYFHQVFFSNKIFAFPPADWGDLWCTLVEDSHGLLSISKDTSPWALPSGERKNIHRKRGSHYSYWVFARCANLVEEIFGIEVIFPLFPLKEVRKWARMPE